VRRSRTFETLAQLFLAGSQRQPLVLAVENLHWIDPTSEAFLALLIERMAGGAPAGADHHPAWPSCALDGPVVCDAACAATSGH
jgi:predicted ATPase